jgi:hypothetical protein
MQPSVLRGRAVSTLLVSGALVLLAGAGVFAAVRSGGPSFEKKGALYCVEEGEYLYTFDAIWRVEALRRIDPATGVASPVPVPEAGRLDRMRGDLLLRLKVDRLEGIPVEGTAELEAIRALGYI